MADLLIGWKPYETEFKGDAVTMELLPLTVPLFKAILPNMKKIEDKDEASQNALEMLGKCLPIFQNHVRNIKGLTINGAAPTAEQIHEEAMLIHFAQDIVNELFMRSVVTKEQEGNLNPPSVSSEKSAENPGEPSTE